MVLPLTVLHYNVARFCIGQGIERIQQERQRKFVRDYRLLNEQRDQHLNVRIKVSDNFDKLAL